MPDHSAPPLMAVRARCLRSDAVLCSDLDPASDFFVRQNGVPHYRSDAKRGPFVIAKAFTSKLSTARRTASNAS